LPDWRDAKKNQMHEPVIRLTIINEYADLHRLDISKRRNTHMTGD